MNIKLFLEIAGEFFDQMYAGEMYNYYEYEEEDDEEEGEEGEGIEI